MEPVVMARRKGLFCPRTASGATWDRAELLIKVG
jgi:hypothetical protein